MSRCNDISQLKCDIKVSRATNLDLDDTYIRCYMLTCNGKKICINSSNIFANAYKKEHEVASFECKGNSSCIKQVVDSNKVLVELRSHGSRGAPLLRKFVGHSSKLLGKAEVALKDILGAKTMRYEELIKVQDKKNSSVLVEVEVKVKVNVVDHLSCGKRRFDRRIDHEKCDYEEDVLFAAMSLNAW